LPLLAFASKDSITSLVGRDAVAGMLYYPFFNAPPRVLNQAVLY
jgi:hypothetical protein